MAASLQREKRSRAAGSVMVAVILFQSVLGRLRRIEGTLSETAFGSREERNCAKGRMSTMRVLLGLGRERRGASWDGESWMYSAASGAGACWIRRGPATGIPGIPGIPREEAADGIGRAGRSAGGPGRPGVTRER